MSETAYDKSIFDTRKICVIVPTYNNGKTIAGVIHAIRKYTENIIVVNDGSTDNTLQVLKSINGIQIVGYEKNTGKGFAIQTGFEQALKMGYDYAITIDSDGQHFPDDLPVFLEALNNNPNALLLGSRNIQSEGMPSRNTFANKFSNFWFWAETGLRLPDTQSGFRLYPIKYYKSTRFFTRKYEFEIEVLVRSAWSGIEIQAVPVRVYYPPEEERITHFRPLPDFGRISVLNTILVLIAFLYILPLKGIKYLANNKLTTVIKEQLSLHNENPLKVSTALGFGVFMGIVPIWGFQMLAAAFLAHFLRLNKVLVLVAANISIPPVIPFIIYFSYKTGGLFMHNTQEFTTETLTYLKTQIMTGNFYETLNEFGYSIFQYVMGSLVFGLMLGSVTVLLSYLILKIVGIMKKERIV
jgi:glycosyltransferase involved in cell wall biosynthesis